MGTITDQFETNKNDYMMFVRDNASYYINKFSKIKQTGDSISWNWSAFIFCPYWLLYRKMYKWGLIIAAVEMAIGSLAISRFVEISLGLYTGIMGNSIYLNHVEKELDYANNLNEDEKQQFLRGSGGTSIGSVFLFLSVIIIGFAVIYFT